MSVYYDPQKRIFKLDTPNTSYIMELVDEFGYLVHDYYGPKLPDCNVSYLNRCAEPPYTPEKNPRDKLSFTDGAPLEYPTGGIGDFRAHALEVRTAGGHNAVELGYVIHSIYKGKKPLEGLPATFSGEEDCTSLSACGQP